MANRLASYLRRLRNVLVVLLAVAVGVLYPTGAAFVQPFTVAIVTFLVFSSLRDVSLTWGRLRSSAGPIGIVLVVSYLVIPTVGILWARLFLDDAALLGVAAMLAAPTTAGSAIVWTRVGGGNDELSGITSLASIALAPVVTPLVLIWLVGEFHALPVVPLATQLLLITAAAVGLLAIVPTETVDDGTIEWGSVGAILLLIYAGVGTAGIGTISVTFLAHVGLLVGVVFAVGLLVGLVLCLASNRSREDVLSVFYSGTLKNLGISLVVVLPLGSTVAIHAIIVYYVSQQLFSAVLLDGLALGVHEVVIGDREF